MSIIFHVKRNHSLHRLEALKALGFSVLDELRCVYSVQQDEGSIIYGYYGVNRKFNLGTSLIKCSFGILLVG